MAAPDPNKLGNVAQRIGLAIRPVPAPVLPLVPIFRRRLRFQLTRILIRYGPV